MSFKRYGWLSKVAILAMSLSTAVLTSGCPGKFKLIDHVTFTPSDNLESVKVSLVFTNRIQTNVSGAFTVGDYGYLFVNPFTPTQPFEVGFSLDTDIVNDQHYAQLNPTEVFPNGLPIGLGYALVQIQAESPISSKFDLYGYVDVLHTSWLGTAAIFSFINDQYFPNDLSISQVFLRNGEGKPGVIASVFGPSVDNAGNMSRAGGIAVLANVRQLLEGGQLRPGQSVTFYPEATMPMVTGGRAGEYRGNARKLRALESNLVRAFNSQAATLR
jgi:hypothetical protein